jgi:hypothetical protein
MNKQWRDNVKVGLLMSEGASSLWSREGVLNIINLEPIPALVSGIVFIFFSNGPGPSLTGSLNPGGELLYPHVAWGLSDGLAHLSPCCFFLFRFFLVFRD